jgi:glycosyltransferase involved in cell wall biosynthesis
MDKIRVAHLVSLATVGGVERFFTNFACRSSQTFEHHVFLSTDKVHDFFKPKLKEAGIQTHSLRKWGPVYLPKFPSLLRAKAHANLVKETGVRALVLWNKLEHFPIHFPAGLPLIHFERGSAWLATQDQPVREHLKRCHAILANSAAGVELIRGRWGLPASLPIRIAHNGVNPLFTESPAPVKERGDIIRLGFAGRFVPLKGWVLALMTLKELLARHPGKYKLVVAGEGRQKALFQSLMLEWNLSDHVEDMGLVKDMREFFKRIDVFLHTSLREPFGNVAVEAQALGCPVIGGWMDGNPEIIRDGETGILLPMEKPVEDLRGLDESFTEVPPFVWDPLTRVLRPPTLMSPQKMADAVETITASSESLRRFSTQAAAWIRSEYDFNKRSLALENVLKEIVP